MSTADKVTKPYTTLIVGYGVVGKNLSKELASLYPDINDNHELKNYSGIPYSVMDCVDVYLPECYDVAFICVDTPLDDDKKLDISQVEAAIAENEAKIYVIKSTVPIGFTEQLIAKTNKQIVYSPEYYGNTPHSNHDKFNFNYTILGGEPNDCIAVQQLLQYCYNGTHLFRIVDARTAEIAKLMENAWIATKVSFCNQFYDIANSNNVNYETLRELFILDPRVNPSHTFVYSDHPYWDSHCLNKDVQYVAYSQDAELLQEVCKFNEHRKAT